MNIQALNSDYVKLRNLADYAGDYRVLWKEADETFHEQRIILDCEPKTLKELLKISMDFKLQGPFRVCDMNKELRTIRIYQKIHFQNWFLTHLDTHSSGLRDIYNEDFKANITSVRIKTVDPNPFERKKTRITMVDVSGIPNSQRLKTNLVYFLANFGKPNYAAHSHLRCCGPFCQLGPKCYCCHAALSSTQSALWQFFTLDAGTIYRQRNEDDFRG